MQVRDVMTEGPAVGTPEMPLQQLAALMVQCDCGSIPIVEAAPSRKLVGIVTDRDITCRTVAAGLNPLEMTAGDIMTRPVVMVHLRTRLDDCIEAMEQYRIRRVPVVDEHGRVCGIIAQADIAHILPAPEVAEMLDEISDASHEPSEIFARR
ncbi:MAG: hypothetical protein K0Q72_4921 [Armatimonadetes bacterium]|jgi:CBS domain-containing protein|nr:hypothetical protein [Armatimonadota bacterium]